MTKFALSSDWHLHSYQGPRVRTRADGTNGRLMDILECGEDMIGKAEKRGCTAFLHGGDLTHNRKQMANEAWARVAQFMRKMSQRIPTWVLEGNHDMSASGDGTSTVGALDGFITAVAAPRVTTIGNCKVGWIPYAEDPEQVREFADTLSRKGARILIAHLGLGDPRFAKCVPIDYETPGRIQVTDLFPDRFEQVFLGHYHTAHEILPNVRYMGSPLQLDFKERGEVKGFWTFDTDTGEVEFVENTDSPKFHEMTANQAIAQLAHGEIPKTDFVWVRDAQRGDAEALRQVSREADMPMLRVDSAPQDRDIAVRVDPESPLVQQLDQYTRHVAPKEQEEERVALIGVGQQLLTAAAGEP